MENTDKRCKLSRDAQDDGGNKTGDVEDQKLLHSSGETEQGQATVTSNGYAILRFFIFLLAALAVIFSLVSFFKALGRSCWSNALVVGALLGVGLGYVYVATRYGVYQWGWYGGLHGHVNVKLTLTLQLITLYSLCRLALFVTFHLNEIDWNDWCLGIAVILSAICTYWKWWIRSGWQIWTSIHGQGPEKYKGSFLLFAINVSCLALELQSKDTRTK